MIKAGLTAKRQGEKGAALVMALMVSFLLLAASAGLLLESSLNTQNVSDATAEQQAYNAAESGIQSVISLLRYKCTAAVSPCKVRPNPLLDTTVPDYNKANAITYSRALSTVTSDVTGDTSTTPRLSRWLSYDSTATDRVILGSPATYAAINGYAYAVSVSDPDNTGTGMTLSTTGRLYDHDATSSTKRTYGTGLNTISVEYLPVGSTSVVASGAGVVATDFGSFVYNKPTGSAGTLIPAVNRFEIIVNMTAPITASRVVRGFIEMNTSASTPPNIIFDSQTYDLDGSDITLSISGGTMRQTGTAPFGYEAALPVSSALTLSTTISAPQPTRLLIKSTGFGPRGATKQLQAIIQNNYFSGLGAPATITMVGPPSTTNPATTFTFDPGTSNAMLYSGQDAATGSTDIIPPVGVTSSPDPLTGDDPNLDAITSALSGKLSDNTVGVPSNVSSEVPAWLQTPAATDAAVKALYNVALSSADPSNATGRYFPAGTSPSTWGDNTNATGITFCDGDCTFGPGSGGGILVVTGQLTLKGNFSFNGLIIVTGQGGVTRSGGGNGTIQGNLIIAPYVASTISGNTDPASGAGFLAPQYNTGGGGNSTITYNSNNQLSGLGAVSNIMLGVVEK
jgi:hypothetical protein